MLAIFLQIVIAILFVGAIRSTVNALVRLHNRTLPVPVKDLQDIQSRNFLTSAAWWLGGILIWIFYNHLL